MRRSALKELRARAERAGVLPRVRTFLWCGQEAEQGAAALDGEPIAAEPFPVPARGGAATASGLQPAYDGVLVDAPCSGSGTWRRSPFLRWETNEEAVAAAAALQLRLLRAHAARVRPGGMLLYATCSLSRTENEDVVRAFLASPEGHAFCVAPLAHRFGFPEMAAAEAEGGGAQLQHCLTVDPALHDTDGFFVARLLRGGGG